MMANASGYRCRYCDEFKRIPEPPTTATETIRTGCPNCDRITPFDKLGGLKRSVRALAREGAL